MNNEENVTNVLSDEKLYGSSILEQDERLISDVDNDNVFDEIKNSYSDEDIENMRNELKSTSDDNKVIDKTYTDTISGIKSSEKVNNSTKESISDIIDSKEKSGKEISLAGFDLIYNLLDTKPTDDEIESLSSYFKYLISADDIYVADINVLKNILGERITDKLIDVANKNGVSEYSAITRFIAQLYKSYNDIVQYNDDINELYDIVMNLSKNTEDLDKIDDENSIVKQYKFLSDATEKLKKLDDRNKRMKNEYCLTDFDILAIDSVKKCLEDAISFKRIYDKLDTINLKKVKGDLRSNDEIKKYIGNWINDLRDDSETLFTFPVNDYLRTSESVDEFINYIKGFILLQDKCDTDIGSIMMDNNTIDNLDKYLLDNKYVTNKELKNYENSAILLLYILSKVFKKKKIKTNDDRRVLSYTLDMISKISKFDYSYSVMGLINDLSERFLKISPYNRVELNGE